MTDVEGCIPYCECTNTFEKCKYCCKTDFGNQIIYIIYLEYT